MGMGGGINGCCVANSNVVWAQDYPSIMVAQKTVKYAYRQRKL